MTTNLELAMTALETVMLLVSLAIVIYGPWQTYCTDAARQTLFEVRAELFDMARGGELSFESEEYRAIRKALNQNIRYAHVLTIWRFLNVIGFLRKHGLLEQKSELTRAIDSIEDDNLRAKVADLAHRSATANIQMMAAKAPAFILLLLGFVFLSWLQEKFDGPKNPFVSLSKRAGEAIQIEAETACA